MAKVLITDTYLTDIANAIRVKNGSNNTYTPAQMASAINNIQTDGNAPNLQNKIITPTANQQVITADSNYDGLSSVTVNGDNNLIPSNIKHDTSIFGVTGTFKTRIEYITMTTTERDTSITFTGLKAEPIAFFYDTMGDITMNRSYRNLTSVSYDGTTVRSCSYYIAGGNAGYGRYFTTCHYTYSNGSLTITSAGTGTSGYFYNGQHILIYIYEE